MSLALEIRSICERELARQGAGGRLAVVGIDVGAFAGVDTQSLQFCLDTILGETFGPVRTEIRRLPGTAVCVACGSEFPVSRAPFECPACGGAACGAGGGDELRVNYLELE
jgi:Zn finger protein HypA/HybF involved in hydrogenase expression